MEELTFHGRRNMREVGKDGFPCETATRVLSFICFADL